MSNRTLDRYLEHENYVNEVACCECGFHRNGQHHPAIKCPRTGRCGSCGNDWPCDEHAEIYGAFYMGRKIVTGTKREMQGKVNNEKRREPGRWEVKPL
jgi:hypothetical protein